MEQKSILQTKEANITYKYIYQTHCRCNNLTHTHLAADLAEHPHDALLPAHRLCQQLRAQPQLGGTLRANHGLSP